MPSPTFGHSSPYANGYGFTKTRPTPISVCERISDLKCGFRHLKYVSSEQKKAVTDFV